MEPDEVTVDAEALKEQMEGFAAAADLTTVTQRETTQVAEPVTPDVEAKVQDVPAEPAVPDAPKKVIGDYTEQQVVEMLAKAGNYDKMQTELNKAFGKIGGFEQQLKALSEAKPAAVQLTAEDVADYEQEYGAEAANALLKVLNKLGTKQSAPAAEPKADIAKMQEELEAKIASASNKSAEVETKLTKEFERKVLDITHKGWQKLVNDYDANGNYVKMNDKFAKWVKGLPEADQTKILHGWDASFVSDKLTEYKEAMKKLEAPAPKAAAPATPNRLKAAVTPTGVPGQASTKTALQEMMEGYNSV